MIGDRDLRQQKGPTHLENVPGKKGVGGPGGGRTETPQLANSNRRNWQASEVYRGKKKKARGGGGEKMKKWGERGTQSGKRFAFRGNDT